MEAGEYTVQFLLKNDDLKIESNILTINITAPPPEELKAFNLYNNAWVDRYTKIDDGNRKVRKKAEKQSLMILWKSQKNIRIVFMRLMH